MFISIVFKSNFIGFSVAVAVHSKLYCVALANLLFRFLMYRVSFTRFVLSSIDAGTNQFTKPVSESYSDRTADRGKVQNEKFPVCLRDET